MRAAALAALVSLVGAQAVTISGATAQVGTAPERFDPKHCAVFSEPGQRETTACFDGVVDRYGHRVLGDTPEFETLFLKRSWIDETLENARERQAFVRLPLDRIFEDVAPRLADITGDGWPEAIVVEADQNEGARLAIYGFDAEGWPEMLAATPYIGSRNRWLAPAGAADFNGDGQLDVAYVQTPHIGGILRIWTLRDGELVELAQRAGLSNHRIGQAFIPGGIRDCGEGPQVVTADQGWGETVVSWLEDGQIASRTVADDAALGTLDKAMACEIR